VEEGRRQLELFRQQRNARNAAEAGTTTQPESNKRQQEGPQRTPGPYQAAATHGMQPSLPPVDANPMMEVLLEQVCMHGSQKYAKEKVTRRQGPRRMSCVDQHADATKASAGAGEQASFARK
jgi:hypothetical protein